MEVEVARPVPTMMESVSKKVQLKTRGKVFGVVREQYLRTGCIILYMCTCTYTRRDAYCTEYHFFNDIYCTCNAVLFMYV